MTVQTSSRRRVAESQGAAIKENVVASRFANAYLQGTAEVASAETLLAGAKTSALETCKAALAGVDKVTQAEFERTWTEPLKAALKASGRFEEKSIPPKVGALKVVILGLTNGYATLPSDTIKGYEARIRPALIKDGVYTPANAGGAKAKPAADKAAKKAQSEFVTACEVVSLHNATLADNLALVMADAEGRKELETLVAEIAEEIRAKDKEEEKTSRRRK